MPATLDLTFVTFGRLWALSPTRTASGHRAWLCLCECGNKTVVGVGHLRKGHTRSCGCLHRDMLSESKPAQTHGHSSTPTWNSWSSMRERCLNPNANGYKYWGGSGITICGRWDRFEGFLADMGERPEGHTLDRIDPDGNYEAGNCRWATAKEQNNNRRPRRTKTTSKLALHTV